MKVEVKGLVLNTKKLELKQQKLSFFGPEYINEGMDPCRKKVKGM